MPLLERFLQQGMLDVSPFDDCVEVLSQIAGQVKA
jgi:flagellum-specific ATP synthase